MSKSRDFIPNRVFIGCPWSIRTKYDRAIEDFRKTYPLTFVIIGNKKDGQDATELLGIIKEKIESSSRAIFDATGGNANVSLEYGFAEALNIERSIYMSTHKHRSSASSGAIISDLAGKKRNHYKQEDQLRRLLGEMARDHHYTKRFETCLKQGGSRSASKRRARTLALKVIHSLERQEETRRGEVVQSLLSDPVRYKPAEVDAMIQRLHGAGLIRVSPGRTSYVRVA